MCLFFVFSVKISDNFVLTVRRKPLQSSLNPLFIFLVYLSFEDEVSLLFSLNFRDA